MVPYCPTLQWGNAYCLCTFPVWGESVRFASENNALREVNLDQSGEVLVQRSYACEAFHLKLFHIFALQYTHIRAYLQMGSQ